MSSTTLHSSLSSNSCGLGGRRDYVVDSAAIVDLCAGSNSRSCIGWHTLSVIRLVIWCCRWHLWKGGRSCAWRRRGWSWTTQMRQDHVDGAGEMLESFFDTVLPGSIFGAAFRRVCETEGYRRARDRQFLLEQIITTALEHLKRHSIIASAFLGHERTGLP